MSAGMFLGMGLIVFGIAAAGEFGVAGVADALDDQSERWLIALLEQALALLAEVGAISRACTCTGTRS